MALHRSRFFPLALRRGFFIELSGAQLGEQTDLFDGALKAAKGSLKGLVFFDSNNRHRGRLSKKFSGAWPRKTHKYLGHRGFWQVSPVVHVLGIETSCDETGVALIRAQPGSGSSQTGAGASGATGEILAQALHSQVALHAAYGGVVPELASRDHIQRLAGLVERVMSEAGVDWAALDAIAFTEGPGLAGALLVGASLAQGLAAAVNKPVIGVHHLEGHLLSPLLDPEAGGLRFPFLALLVSGGHTQIMRVDGLGRYALLGETIDDAAGEAFDKSAQLLGLGYPGGPEIARWSTSGRADRFDLPRPLMRRPTLDFSFAGLKTAVLTHVQKLRSSLALDDQARADMAAAVQAAIVDVLTGKCRKAMRDTEIHQLVVAGGVGANQALRQAFAEISRQDQCRVLFAPPHLCTDNGVMIAWAAALRVLGGQPPSKASGFSVRPRWPLTELPLV